MSEPSSTPTSSSYPLTTATNKHDLLCVRGASDSSSPSAVVFSSSSELFKKVISYDDKDFAKNGQPEKKGFVYSYKDGPEYPGACFFRSPVVISQVWFILVYSFLPTVESLWDALFILRFL